MTEIRQTQCIAFHGNRQIARGSLADVAAAVKGVLDGDRRASVLIFDCVTSRLVEVDLRGSADDVLRRVALASAAGSSADCAVDDSHRGRGRPKLGVVAREVTLLPRHWDWLAAQPGGASIALRKLVEDARRVNAGRDRTRAAQEAAYKFMSALGGDLPGFEEASRALFAGDRDRFAEHVAHWPPDVRDHAQWLAFGDDDRTPATP